MKTYRPNENQPVLMSDAHGVLYVDHGDDTVFLVGDQDGERDTPWFVLWPEVSLHTTSCRTLGLAEDVCPGDRECADTERRAAGLARLLGVTW